MFDHNLNIKQLNSKLASYKKYKPFFLHLRNGILVTLKIFGISKMT